MVTFGTWEWIYSMLFSTQFPLDWLIILLQRGDKPQISQIFKFSIRKWRHLAVPKQSWMCCTTTRNSDGLMTIPCSQTYCSKAWWTNKSPKNMNVFGPWRHTMSKPQHNGHCSSGVLYHFCTFLTFPYPISVLLLGGAEFFYGIVPPRLNPHNLWTSSKTEDHHGVNLENFIRIAQGICPIRHSYSKICCIFIVFGEPYLTPAWMRVKIAKFYCHRCNLSCEANNVKIYLWVIRILGNPAGY